MPGTGDVTYVLGPSLVALALAVVLFVAIRARRRGPVVTPRSAPDHGLPQPTAEAGDRKPLIPPQRRAGALGASRRDADGENLIIRLSDATRERAVTRRVLSQR